MFGRIPKDEVAAATPLVPDFVRADGGVRLRFGTIGDHTSAIERAESGGFRVRLPRTHGACEAVLINTGGGMAGGDRMAIDVALDAGAEAVVTTQAAEKIYRSQGPVTTIAARLDLSPGSRLAWLPQETILFSGSRFRRELHVAMTADASLTVAESIVFGRVAMDEVLGRGLCHDRWRISRGGKLVFAEDVRLDGDIAALLAAKATGDAAKALATILHVAPDAEARLEEVRGLLTGCASECGVSAWDGLLVMRFLARDPQALRGDLICTLEKFRHARMPRSW